MRPKSSATVVVVLPSTPARSSTLPLISLITSSVRSGAISLTEPTKVVLPTPKPPAISSFTADVPRVGWPEVSKPTDAIKYRLKYVHVRIIHSSWRSTEKEEALLDQIANQNLHDGKRHIQLCADLGDRQRALAQSQDLGVLPIQRAVVGVNGDHQRDHVQVSPARPGTTASDRIRPDHGAGLVVVPGLPTVTHYGCAVPGAPLGLRGSATRWLPTCLTIRVISYAIIPMSAFAAASRARQVPKPAAVTTK